MSGQESRLLGRWGEAQAGEWLRKHGCTLLAANWRCRYGEIDLIVQDGTCLCFVEVKLRKDSSFASAGAFVDRRKQDRLRTTAELYLSQHTTPLQPRFDVVEVYAPSGIQTRTPQIRWLKNAF